MQNGIIFALDSKALLSTQAMNDGRGVRQTEAENYLRIHAGDYTSLFRV